eukprot:162338-Prymnesium_polylepis.2
MHEIAQPCTPPPVLANSAACTEVSRSRNFASLPGKNEHTLAARAVRHRPGSCTERQRQLASDSRPACQRSLQPAMRPK